MERYIPIDPLESSKKYNQKSLVQQKPKPFLLNITLTSNPFLKDQENFHYLVYVLKEYNKRVSNNQVTDNYQAMTYQFLFRLISDLALFETKDDQITALNQVFNWFKDQDSKIGRRKQMGIINYKVTKQVKHGIPQIQKQEEKSVDISTLELVTSIKDAILEPYLKNNRTIHQEQNMPPTKLTQYKRKIINITSFLENKQEVKPTRILYPKPVKVQEPKQVQENLDNPQEQNQVPIQKPQQGQQQKKQGQATNQQGKPIEEQQKIAQDQNAQQDLGGFGQEPQQPQQQQPQEVDDKLAPKTKVYTSAITPPNKKRKFYMGQYLHFKGEQILPQRTMQQRYIKMQQIALKKQKQEQQMTNIAHNWATRKSKITKQLQRKLENLQMQPKYSFMREQQAPPQRLKIEDEIKYGLTLPVRKTLANPQIDLTGESMKLPSIGKTTSFHEKNCRRDRLLSLKQKFGKMLNISQYQDRQTAASICQYTSRRRDLSQILNAHSKSKQRLIQLQEVTKLKQRMTRNKLAINYKSLSDAICLPQDQQTNNSMLFPDKMLLNNPFWVQPKKKKKKK